jgi:hypothetical protein
MNFCFNKKSLNENLYTYFKYNNFTKNKIKYQKDGLIINNKYVYLSKENISSVKKYLKHENNIPRTLKKIKNKQKIGLKCLKYYFNNIPHNRKKYMNRLCKSFYYQIVLTYVWLFMKKSILYNSFCFFITKTNHRHILFNINNETFVVKTYGYIIHFSNRNCMTSCELAKFFGHKINKDYREIGIDIPFLYIERLQKYLCSSFDMQIDTTPLPYYNNINTKLIFLYTNDSYEIFNEYLEKYKTKYFTTIKSFVLENKRTFV